MRTEDVQQGGLFSYISLESRIPLNHPIRKLRVLVDTILKEMDADFAPLYSSVGRPSIPPERLLRALLLQIVFSVRSERLLMERMDYDLLFRWFVGLDLDDPVWDHSTFSFNRERLFGSQVAEKFFRNTVLMARVGKLTSDEHFTVDGTLLEAWASHKSFKPRDDDSDRGDGTRNPDVDFRGEQRKNDTHASTTDPDARLYRKGSNREAKLSYQANALMDNRIGLVVDVDVRHASGTAERDGAYHQGTVWPWLLGAYVEMASRVVVSEQPSDRWLLAMAAYCQAATDKLRDAAEFYARGHRTSDDDRASYLGHLAGAQQAGQTFAEHLEQRFDSLGLSHDDPHVGL